MRFNSVFKALIIYVQCDQKVSLHLKIVYFNQQVSGDFLINLHSSSVRDGTAVNKVTGQKI